MNAREARKHDLPGMVLIIDDDAVFRQTLHLALERRGYTAFQAGNSAEALIAARRERPDYAILDLRMPGENGLALIAPLLELYPSLRIIVLTGYGSISTAVEAMRLGAYNYLTKPVDADSLIAAFAPSLMATAMDEGPSENSLALAEWEHIQEVLTTCAGNVSRAAKALGLHRRSLQRKLARGRPSPVRGDG